METTSSVLAHRNGGLFSAGGHPTKSQVVEPNHVVLCGIYCRKFVSVPCWFDAFVVWHTNSPTCTTSKYSLSPSGVLYFVALYTASIYDDLELGGGIIGSTNFFCCDSIVWWCGSRFKHHNTLAIKKSGNKAQIISNPKIR